MAESLYPPEHARKVIELTCHELEVLLIQQRALGERVRQVKGALRALRGLFETAQPNRPPHLAARNDSLGSTKGGRGGSASGEASLPLNADPEETSRPTDAGVNKKLERACRIALLESVEVATAAEIYDRIIRRGSYKLNRYKHPLVQVTKALDGLVLRDEVKAIAGMHCPRWAWNSTNVDSEQGKPGPPPEKQFKKAEYLKVRESDGTPYSTANSEPGGSGDFGHSAIGCPSY